ncbi:MAG: AAA family ATPase [Aeoliella sp.]
MTTAVASGPSAALLDSLMGDESYYPREPLTLEEVGVSPVLIEGLAIKFLLQVGTATGREISTRICLPFPLMEDLLADLRKRQVVVHTGQGQFNDYTYRLTDEGAERARGAMQACAYVGPVPVPLEDYIVSVEAQTIRAEAVQRKELAEAFKGISVEPTMLEILGPAINSGAGLFLYGAPGNGKTTLAKRITRCFGNHIWIPRTLIEDGQFVKLFDAAFHEPIEAGESSIIKSATVDTRWVKILRPTVVVGGELTMDSLEIRHDPVANVSEASLQLKSNGGCLLIDDFGRQRVEPTELLNRWIVPLENRFDFLSLATGRKIQVPFDQLIIFSTNLEPEDLADEAFLRRIPYKVEVGDPSLSEFRLLFKFCCNSLGCGYRPEAVDYLVQKHYRPTGRPLRRCQARDLLAQVQNYCVYQGVTLELRPDYLDRAVSGYFTATGGGHASEETESSEETSEVQEES